MTDNLILYVKIIVEKRGRPFYVYAFLFSNIIVCGVEKLYVNSVHKAFLNLFSILYFIWCVLSHTDSVQLVFVSCVINPSHFYVQTLVQKKTAVYLEKTLRQFCRSNSSSPEDILELGIGSFGNFWIVLPWIWSLIIFKQ